MLIGESASSDYRIVVKPLGLNLSLADSEWLDLFIQ